MSMNPRLLRPLASFNPLNVAGLEAWWDFSDESTLTLSGNNISEIRDKSGKGWNASQGTGANQPTRTANAINGLTAGVFNGTTSRLVTSASFPAITDITAFSVAYRPWSAALTTGRTMAKTQSYAQFAGHALFAVAGSTSLDFVQGDIVNFGNGFQTGRGPRAIGPFPATSNNQAVVLSVTLTTVRADAWRNGTSLASRVASVGTGSSASGEFTLGSQGTSLFWDGGIGEFIVYRAALSLAQIKAVERYLGAKWGIAIA